MLGIGAPLEETHAPPVDIAQLETEGARIVESAESAARSDRAHALERVVARRRAQLVRRLRAIDGDLARVDEVAPMRERAALLLAHLREIPRDATEAVVMDWSSDPPRPIRIAIDPARGARGEADALFRRARKLERGGEIALERHAETERDIAALDAIARAIPNANEEELARLERDAARLGARAQRPGAAAEAAARRPYRIFSGSRGRTILVGRSAEDNDTLTLRVARPQDHWLHARGVTGAHVVVQLQRGETCPADLLIDAAHLAAYFSDARGEATIEVQHTSRRHVRKPRGSPPGGVVVSREKVIVLRVEPERLQRLLRSEQQA
jgi:predicted ribosome quality control (RQC) complex YloA/Tae2 family protein